MKSLPSVRVLRWLVVWDGRVDLSVSMLRFRPRVVVHSWRQRTLLVWWRHLRLPFASQVVRSISSERRRNFDILPCRIFLAHETVRISSFACFGVVHRHVVVCFPPADDPSIHTRIQRVSETIS